MYFEPLIWNDHKIIQPIFSLKLALSNVESYNMSKSVDSSEKTMSISSSKKYQFQV